jgi:hypothetical protein
MQWPPDSRKARAGIPGLEKTTAEIQNCKLLCKPSLWLSQEARMEARL